MSSSDIDIFATLADIPEDKIALVREMSYLEQRVSSITTILVMDVANELGMNVTDFLALGAIVDHEQMTAGELAIELGLTTGSVTTLVDRLERAGLAMRERGQEDRRKVFIRPATDNFDVTAAPFIELTRPYLALLDTMTDEQLDTVRTYLNASHNMLRSLIEARRERRKNT